MSIIGLFKIARNVRVQRKKTFYRKSIEEEYDSRLLRLFLGDFRSIELAPVRYS